LSPFAEAGDLCGAGEVGGRVLDRVLELVRRDVDREADAIPAELFHLAHAPIQATGARLAEDVPSDGAASEVPEQPRVHLGHTVLDEREVTVLAAEPRVDAVDPSGLPAGVREGV